MQKALIASSQQVVTLMKERLPGRCQSWEWKGRARSVQHKCRGASLFLACSTFSTCLWNHVWENLNA